MSTYDNADSPALYAMQRRVFPVSPTSLYAYLSVILLGLRGMYVEKHAREIVQKLAHLEHQFSLIESEMSTLDTHFRNANNKWDDVRRKVMSVQDDLNRINKEIELPTEE